MIFKVNGSMIPKKLAFSSIDICRSNETISVVINFHLNCVLLVFKQVPFEK